MAPQPHRILSKDIEAGEGVCNTCGPVKLVKRSQGERPPYWACSIAVKARKNSPGCRRGSGKHGMTHGERLEFIRGKVCEVCGSSETLAVDHCHRTSEIRGVLCSPCNMGLGWFRDDPERLRKAAEYLEAKQPAH